MSIMPPPTQVIPFNNSLDEGSDNMERFVAFPTPDMLRRSYLFGIPLENDAGETISNDALNDWIVAAASNFEHEFDQPITPRRFVEPHDYKFQDYQKYGYLQLFHFPILDVDQLQLQFVVNNTLADFPKEWLRVEKATGQIQITPNTAAISSFLISGSGDLPRIFGARAYFPQLIYVNYLAGFKKDEIPAIIVKWMLLDASIEALQIAGDLVFGAGLQSTSIGLGGLSQSISTTKGGGGAFAGRIERYEKQKETLGKTIRRFYKSIKLTTV